MLLVMAGRRTDRWSSKEESGGQLFLSADSPSSLLPLAFFVYWVKLWGDLSSKGCIGRRRRNYGSISLLSFRGNCGLGVQHSARRGGKRTVAGVGLHRGCS